MKNIDVKILVSLPNYKRLLKIICKEIFIIDDDFIIDKVHRLFSSVILEDEVDLITKIFISNNIDELRELFLTGLYGISDNYYYTFDASKVETNGNSYITSLTECIYNDIMFKVEQLTIISNKFRVFPKVRILQETYVILDYNFKV